MLRMRRPFFSGGYRIPKNEMHHGWSNLRSLLPQGHGLCLDLGAGRGRHRGAIEKAGWTWIGLDIVPHRNLSIVGDACHFPFANESLDLVFTNQALEYIPRPLVAIRESCRVLHHGAYLIGSVPYLEPWHDSYFGFSHWAIEELLSTSGFTLKEIWPGTSVFVTLSSALLPGTSLGPFIGKIIGRLVMLLLRWIGVTYVVLRFGKESEQWQRLEAFFKKAPLRFAGHIMFVAQKTESTEPDAVRGMIANKVGWCESRR